MVKQFGFLVTSGLVWGGLFWLWSQRHALQRALQSEQGKFAVRLKPALRRCLGLYAQNDESSELLLIHEIKSFLSTPEGRDNRETWENLLAVIELRRLFYQRPSSGKKALQESFVLRKKADTVTSAGAPVIDSVSFQDIAEAATQVAHLFWKVGCVASGSNEKVSQLARELLHEILGGVYGGGELSQELELLGDAMQRLGGIPFLVLNLIQQKRWDSARAIGQRLLKHDLSIDEETRACLYWMAELTWFNQNAITVSDFESSIRHLYHLCFVNPERAGFLEIDSQFFSQFETVTELAKEGFLFKETLIEKILQLWGPELSCFSPSFKEVLQLLSGQTGKIYQDREVWLRWWEREREEFEKDIFLLLESNLFYSAKDYASALLFVEKALQVNPHLKPALLNRLFCLAKMNKKAQHQAAVEDILSRPTLAPRALSVIGNSYLLLGDLQTAAHYYQQLSEVEGWRQKTDYYQSTFCFEHGLYEQALEFARKAHALNPKDLSMSFHLSQCLSAVGLKREALQILHQAEGKGPQWLNYFRFTLERDAGQLQDAYRTLSQIPSEYFDDPEELEAALEFAKNTSDLNLLRRLKAQR